MASVTASGVSQAIARGIAESVVIVVGLPAGADNVRVVVVNQAIAIVVAAVADLGGMFVDLGIRVVAVGGDVRSVVVTVNVAGGAAVDGRGLVGVAVPARQEPNRDPQRPSSHRHLGSQYGTVRQAFFFQMSLLCTAFRGHPAALNTS